MYVHKNEKGLAITMFYGYIYWGEWYIYNIIYKLNVFIKPGAFAAPRAAHGYLGTSIFVALQSHAAPSITWWLQFASRLTRLYIRLTFFSCVSRVSPRQLRANPGGALKRALVYLETSG